MTLISNRNNPDSVDNILSAAYLRMVMADAATKETAMQRNRLFYSGTQGIQFTARQKEYLGDLATDFTDQALCNVCKRAVGIPLERLAVESITSEQGASTFADKANEWWDINQLGAWQYTTYEYALRDWASCLIVGWDTDHPTYTLNQVFDGTDGQVRLHYSEDSGDLLYASKRFKQVDPQTLLPTKTTMLTLYFEDRIERYDDNVRKGGTIIANWRLLQDNETPEGKNPLPWLDARGQAMGIPVITFENPCDSELDDILMPQKALNKSAVDMLSAQDLQGFPLMVLKGYKAVIGADGKPTQVRISPGEAITIGDPNGAAERIPGVDLGPMFETGIMGWIWMCSIIKGWPVYLWMKGDPPSGESLKVMEASLVSQVKRKQEAFRDSWLEAFTMGAKLHELYKRETLTGDLTINWKEAETRQDLVHWQSLQTKWDAAQVPLHQRWKEAGYTDDQIAEMEAETQRIAVDAAVRSIQGALMAQRNMSQLGGDTITQPLLQSANGNGNGAVTNG